MIEMNAVNTPITASMGTDSPNMVTVVSLSETASASAPPGLPPSASTTPGLPINSHAVAATAAAAWRRPLILA